MITISIRKGLDDLKVGTILGRAYLCNDLKIKDGHTNLFLGNTGITDKITDIVDIYNNVVVDRIGIDYVVFQISWKNRGILDNLFYPGDNIPIMIQNRETGHLSPKYITLNEFSSDHHKRLNINDQWGRNISSKTVTIISTGGEMTDLPISTDKHFDLFDIVICQNQ